MGGPLGRLYHELSNELAWLTIKWSEYVELFGTKPSRIDLLNEAAGGFFRLIQDALWDDLLLHVARLTDLAEMRGRRNLTICALPNLIDRPEISKAVSEKIAICVELAGFARDWRNRRIAHRDLALSLEEEVEPLMSASRAKFKQALSAITDAMNEVSRPYLDSTTAYDFLENSAGAVSLLHVLDGGIRSERKRKGRLESGDYREDDFAPRNL